MSDKNQYEKEISAKGNQRDEKGRILDNFGVDMPKELKTKISSLTTFQKAYAELRGRGLPRPDAALKAGSKATGRKALARMGYQLETQNETVAAYIRWIVHARAKMALVDDNEVVFKLRQAYDHAMNDGKYSDAIKAAELLGKAAGTFETIKETNKKNNENDVKAGPKNNVNAFKDGDETQEEKVKKLNRFLKEVTKVT